VPIAKQLKKAESTGVDVIGISVGVDESNVDQVFGKWCKAALPPAVPDALRELFSDERSGALSKSEAADNELRLEKWKLRGEATGTVDIKEMYSKFAELQKELRKTRIATLERGDSLDSITVDLVFVVDMTGSMRQTLPILLAQFQAMVDSTSEHSIPSKILNDPTNPGVQINLHCAALGFRDQGDLQQFVEVLHPEGRFFDTSDGAENTQFLNGLKQCESMGKGGGDACEDVAGAFERAANWHWKGKARFMVLVTDNPCHGSQFHTFGEDQFQDSRHHASSDSREAFRRGFQRCIEQEIRMLHCTCSRSATDKMSDEMYRILLDVEQAQGSNFKQKVVTSAQRRDITPAELRIDIGINVKDQASQSLHIVFCLDESGSMSGSPWSDLIGALNRFWMMRAEEQGPAEYVSIVQFDSSARTTHSHVRLVGSPPALSYNGGGTRFHPPAQKARELIDSHGMGPAVVIFMSDGGSNDGNAAAGEFQQIANARGSKFSCYTIGYGSQASTTLKVMAFKEGKQDSSNYRVANIGQLGVAFGDIANSIGESSEASKVLVEEISKEIANKVQNKICLEFL